MLADQYFSADYFTARERFRRSAAAHAGRLESLPIDAKGPVGESLTIDIAWFGRENPRRALLHSSGLHGVEGFAGSAIQLQMLDELPACPSDTALVLVHTLNPYGMAWLRRVNENNVDLNRNFGDDGSYKGASDAYARLNSFLNPPSPPAADVYFAKAVYLILRYGMPALKQAVVGGQYEFSRGLFFGGKASEQGPAAYQAFLKQRLGNVARLIVIDVHTGIGKFGEDALLVDSKDYARFRSLFGERVKEMQPDAGPAYRIQGGIESMIFRVFSKIDPYFVCQEFGTYSGMNVLHALREENRWHHYGGGAINHPTKVALKKTFCPDDERWRDAVLRRGRELLAQTLEELAHHR